MCRRWRIGLGLKRIMSSGAKTVPTLIPVSPRKHNRVRRSRSSPPSTSPPKNGWYNPQKHTHGSKSPIQLAKRRKSKSVTKILLEIPERRSTRAASCTIEVATLLEKDASKVNAAPTEVTAPLSKTQAPLLSGVEVWDALTAEDGSAALLVFRCDTVSGEYSSGLSKTYQDAAVVPAAIAVRQRMMEAQGHSYSVLVWNRPAFQLAGSAPICHYSSYASAVNAVPPTAVPPPISYRSPRPADASQCAHLVSKDLIHRARQLGESFCKLHSKQNGFKSPY